MQRRRQDPGERRKLEIDQAAAVGLALCIYDGLRFVQLEDRELSCCTPPVCVSSFPFHVVLYSSRNGIICDLNTFKYLLLFIHANKSWLDFRALKTGPQLQWGKGKIFRDLTEKEKGNNCWEALSLSYFHVVVFSGFVWRSLFISCPVNDDLVAVCVCLTWCQSSVDCGKSVTAPNWPYKHTLSCTLCVTCVSSFLRSVILFSLTIFLSFLKFCFLLKYTVLASPSHCQSFTLVSVFFLHFLIFYFLLLHYVTHAGTPSLLPGRRAPVGGV